jgi:uroporphyrinogen decarboxylase
MEEQFIGSQDKYIHTNIFMLLFERLYSLRGFDKLLMDLVLEKEKCEKLADRIVEFDLRIIENISTRFPGEIQGLFFTEDLGTQQATIFSRKIFDDFFAPRYSKIFTACHQVGWHVWMHSCGKINNFIQPLIDTGVDVINLQQPRALGIEEIGSEFSGKICFANGCDIQHTLPFKSDEEIIEEARLILSSWSTQNGGFIFYNDDENDHDLNIPMAKKRVELDAFIKYDPWKTNRGTG